MPMNPPGSSPVALVLTHASAGLRCRLEPLPWMVLEQLALDAVENDGRLLAASSARRIAGQLRIEPGEAARALRTLRAAGLVELIRPAAADDRLELTRYLLGETPGLFVLADGVHPPPAVDELVAPARAVRTPSGPPRRAGTTGEPATKAATDVRSDSARPPETTVLLKDEVSSSRMSERRHQPAVESGSEPGLGLTERSPS